jgi:HK97 family phage major capsid protein
MKVLALKSSGEMVLRILGAPFGGPFNGKDHDGDYFDAKTNIHQDIYTEIPLIYSHGFDPKTGEQSEVPVFLGKAKYSHVDEDGHWYEAVLDKTSEVATRLWHSALKGLVKASSGAINYLVRRAKDGRLIEWGLAELSIIDTSEGMNPANPYAVAVPMLKAHFKEAGIEFNEPEESGEDSVQTDPVTINESTTMTEEEKKAKEQADIDAAAEDAKKAKAAKADDNDVLSRIAEEMKVARDKKQVEDRKKAEQEQKIRQLIADTMQAEPADNGGSRSPAILRLGRGDDEKKAFGHYLRTGDRKALVILNETVDEQGGAVVPTDIYTSIVELRDPYSVARRMGAEVIKTSRLTINIPEEATRLTKPADTAESQTATATSRLINQVEPVNTQAVTVDNYTFLLRLSEELVNDKAFNIETWIANRIAKNFAVVENSALKLALYADVSNTVNAADDLTVAIGDIFNLYYDVDEPYRDGGVWLMKGSVEAAVRQLAISNNFAFQATPAGAAGQTSQYSLMGPNNKVFNLADMDAITTSKKVIFFGAPEYCKLVENGTMTIRRLNERYADTGEVGFVASSRFAMKFIGGGETWSYLLTLAS